MSPNAATGAEKSFSTQHLEHAVRYVECNPVRAGMADRAEDYPWSSAIQRVLGTEDRYLDAGLPFIEAIRDWSAWLAGESEESCLGRA
jgi:putative transposase